MSDAVERVARALFIKGGPYHPQTELQSARDRARALLAEITPLLVAEEREACAKVAEGFTGWTGKPHQSNMDFGPNMPPKVAAAIRARGGEG